MVNSKLKKRLDLFNQKPYWFGGIAFMLLVIVLPKSLVVINSGERGIILSFGKAQETTLSEGIYPILPFVSSVHIFDTRVQRTNVETTTRTKDLQRISTKVVLNWQIQPSKIQQIYQQFQAKEDLADKIIDPVMQELVKAAVPSRSLEKNLRERAELKQEIEEQARKRLEPYGIVVVDLSVTDVTASEEFTKATEEKQIAEQKAISAKLVAEQELQKADYESKKAAKEAEAAIARAKGQAESQKLLQSSLSPEILQKQAIEKWDGKFPVVMSGNESLPFIKLDIPSSSSNNANPPK